MTVLALKAAIIIVGAGALPFQVGHLDDVAMIARALVR